MTSTNFIEIGEFLEKRRQYYCWGATLLASPGIATLTHVYCNLFHANFFRVSTSSLCAHAIVCRYNRPHFRKLRADVKVSLAALPPDWTRINIHELDQLAHTGLGELISLKL